MVDITAILSSIKGKVLDAKDFELLKHAYDLQNENIDQLKSNNDALKEKAGLLEEKITLLNKENKSLKAAVETLKSRLEALPKAGELSEDEKKILVLLSSCGHGATAGMIAQAAGLSLTKTEYYLQRMCEQDYVYPQHYLGSRPTLYYLSEKGRAYLVENGLVE